MRKIFLALFLIAFLVTAIIKVQNQAYSDELDDISKKINELTQALQSSQKATAPFLAQLSDLKKQIGGIENRVAFIEQDIIKKQKNIDIGYKDLEKQQDLFNRAVRSYYIKTYSFNPLLVLISTVDAGDTTRILAYQRKGQEQDKAIITNIALKIAGLETQKKDLQQEQNNLTIMKTKLAVQKADVQKLVDGAQAYQSSISGQIAELSAKQQSILSQRLSSLNIPRSAGTSLRGCSDDRAVDPGFSPRIAFFTYGAPHRNGMNQYGAWGRAKDGQNEDQILQAYYPGMTLNKGYDQSIQIRTNTGWSGSIEDYVKRIYEVPDSWTDNNLAVLKAQAVAARTYALRSTGNGSNEICTTESCQVFKPDPKGGNWEQAVNATAGWVLMDGGSPGFTQYASTHGGYIQNLGKFDGRVGTPASFAEWDDRAYDKESPWFYCDWGSRSQYGSTAWLKGEEVADIINVILLGRADSPQGKHLYQTDKPNPEGTDTWDAGRVRQELSNRGISPYNNISDISVSPDFGGGKTSSVTVNGDGGTQTISGGEFKNWFNLRAPANLQIVGPLFNVERR